MVNLYDRCTTNSTIDGKQCIIAWHVDKKKVSHVDEHTNTRIIESIAEHFGEITVSRGKEHKFLGMYIEFLGNGIVFLFMKNSIEEYIAQFGNTLDENVSSPEKQIQSINKK